MKVVQQLTCLTLDRPNGPAYSTGELLNTPKIHIRGTVANYVSMATASEVLYGISSDVYSDGRFPNSKSKLLPEIEKIKFFPRFLFDCFPNARCCSTCMIPIN